MTYICFDTSPVLGKGQVVLANFNRPHWILMLAIQAKSATFSLLCRRRWDEVEQMLLGQDYSICSKIAK